MKRSWIIGLVAAASIATTGCADELDRAGSIAHAPVAIPRLPTHANATVGIGAPTDGRPAVEHTGQTDKMALFFTIAVVTHWEKSGNYVTDDIAATPNASGELRTVLANAIGRAGAARVVPAEARPAFTLETTIQHLYATHYAANEGTVVVIPGSRGPQGGGANVQKRVYADYGNVVLRARLVDQRQSPPAVVFDEIVTGGGESPPEPGGSSAQRALNTAVGDAAGTVMMRVSSALERLGAAAYARPVHDDMPPLFLVERVSRLRDFLELVAIDTRSGRVLRHDIFPLADRAYGRPGEWLLSRRLLDGTTLSGNDYDAFAKQLARKYDLRQYDDVTRYHFFGLLGAVR